MTHPAFNSILLEKDFRSIRFGINDYLFMDGESTMIGLSGGGVGGEWMDGWMESSHFIMMFSFTKVLIGIGRKSEFR